MKQQVPASSTDVKNYIEIYPRRHSEHHSLFDVSDREMFIKFNAHDVFDERRQTSTRLISFLNPVGAVKGRKAIFLFQNSEP